MAPQPIPDDLRRCVLTSIASLPHLEALLLLRSAKNDLWNSTMLAERLYIGDMQALAAAQIDRLAALYGSHLLEVTYLIHSTHERKAHLFADAFKWRKDP